MTTVGNDYIVHRAFDMIMNGKDKLVINSKQMFIEWYILQNYNETADFDYGEFARKRNKFTKKIHSDYSKFIEGLQLLNDNFKTESFEFVNEWVKQFEKFKKEHSNKIIKKYTKRGTI